MKTEIYKDEGCKPMGAAFEVYYEQGCGLAGRPQPAGLPEISRGLSASDTPGTRPENKPHPGGVPELSTHHDPGPSPLIIARFWHPSSVQMIPAFQSGGIASLRSAQPPANFCEPSGFVSKSQSRGAATILTRMGPAAKAAAPALTAVMQEPFSYTRVKAEEALQQIDGQPAAHGLEKLE